MGIYLLHKDDDVQGRINGVIVQKNTIPKIATALI